MSVALPPEQYYWGKELPQILFSALPAFLLSSSRNRGWLVSTLVHLLNFRRWRSYWTTGRFRIISFNIIWNTTHHAFVSKIWLQEAHLIGQVPFCFLLPCWPTLHPRISKVSPIRASQSVPGLPTRFSWNINMLTIRLCLFHVNISCCCTNH